MKDHVLYMVVVALLRAARRLSLLRRPRPWPGLGHARLAAALAQFETEA